MRNKDPVFKATEYFRQLKKILVTKIPPRIIPSITQPKEVVLAIIGPRKTTNETSLDIPFFTEPAKVTPIAIDMNTVMCLVGRIKDRGRRATIDRSGDAARAEFID